VDGDLPVGEVTSRIVAALARGPRPGSSPPEIVNGRRG
jgi:hypothetical protein